MKFARRLILTGVLLTASLGGGQSQPSPPPPTKSSPSTAKDAPKTPARKRLVADLSGFEMSDPSKTRQQRAMLGATRGAASRPPVALAPLLARFYGSAPLFAWLYPGRAAGFEVVLRDDDRNEILSQVVSAAEFRLPDASSRFQPGRTYYWSVRVSPSLMESRFSQAAGFVVVSEQERQQIDKELAAIPRGDEYQAGIARARVLVNHRLWYDAIGAYSDLIRQFPERAELYEERGTVYAQIEVTKAQADADFARADQLQAKKRGK